MKFSDKNLKELAFKILQGNAYFEHHENILLGMLGDEEEDTRRFAVNKILGIRAGNNSMANNQPSQSAESVRKFVITKVNCKAKSLQKMINLDFENKTFEEPPLIRYLTNEEL